jgi:hypothetical protein
MPRPRTSRAVAGGAGDAGRHETQTPRPAKTLPLYRLMRRHRARTSPASIRWSALAPPRQVRLCTRHLQPAITRIGVGGGGVRRSAVWDLRCRRPISVRWHGTQQVTALSQRAPLTASRAQPRQRAMALAVLHVTSGCRYAAGGGFPARLACNAEQRTHRRRIVIRPPATLRLARRARKVSFLLVGGVDACPRVSAKLCQPAKTNRPTAPGGRLIGRRELGNLTAVRVRKARATVSLSNLRSRPVASEVVDRVMGTAADHAAANAANATTAVREDEVRAAREMGNAAGDAMRQQDESSRSSMR